MSATAYPLPLALSKPVPLASDLDSMLATSLGVGSTKYDPETQMRAGVITWRQHVSDETQRAFEINMTWTVSNTVINESEAVAVIDDSFNVDEMEF